MLFQTLSRVSQRFVFDPTPAFPFVVTAKRYRRRGAQTNSSSSTLVFAHGTGHHKEHWEPTLDYICSRAGDNVREAWSVDCPNHGDAAALNEDALQYGYDIIFGWEQYARVLHLFLTGTSPQKWTSEGQQVPAVDFTGHNLVAVGHSMGAVALLFTLTFPNPPRWKSIILVEPMILPLWSNMPSGPSFLEGAERRRDVWTSKQEAYEMLKTRPAFKMWDDRILRIFCEDGLCDLPTKTYPDLKEGVTLKCPKQYEASCYRDPIGRLRSFHYLGEACQVQPVHVIFGAINDAVPGKVKKAIVEDAAGGRLKSVQKVPNAGHLVIQCNPDGVGEAIVNILRGDRDSSKL